MRMVTLVCLLIVALLVPLGQAQAKTPDPRSVNLKLSDMPPGFTLQKSITRDNAAVVKEDKTVTMATLIKQGRIASNEETYGKDSFIGLIYVHSLVEEFTSTAKAAVKLKGVKPGDLSSHKYKPMSITPVGSQSLGWTYTAKTNGINATAYLIVFQRGPYIVIVDGAGVTGTFQEESVGALAAAIDKHIKATM